MKEQNPSPLKTKRVRETQTRTRQQTDVSSETSISHHFDQRYSLDTFFHLVSFSGNLILLAFKRH